MSQPVWFHNADQPANGDMLAIGDGIVAFANGSALCAYDDVTGVGVWCAGRGHDPVYANGLVAFVTDGSGVHAVDARTGALRWSYANARSIWAVNGTFVIGGAPERNPQTNAISVRLTGVDVHGHGLWRATESGDGAASARVVGSNLLWRYAESGATLRDFEVVLGSGTGGGEVITVEGSVLSVGPSSVIVDTRDDALEEIQDHFLTFDVEIESLHSTRPPATYHYEPDYDRNLKLYDGNCCAGSSSGGHEFAEGDYAYLLFNRNVYRYRLAAAQGQHPLLISSGADVLGGPYEGAMYVDRNDGVWSLRPSGNTIRAQRVASSTVAANAVTIERGLGFATFDDGSIQGFNLLTGRATFAATACPGAFAQRIAVTAKRIYVACVTGSSWRVTAYATP